MPIPRFPPTRLAALVAAALVPVAYVQPAPAQDVSSAEIRLSLGSEGARSIGETEKNLAVDILSGLIVHVEGSEPLTVVLSVAHLSGERVVARGESAPFHLDVNAASTSDGVPLGRLLSRRQLLGMAPLKPAEFVVTGQLLARRSMNAADAVADPGPAFPMGDGQEKLIVAVVPADPGLRRSVVVRPLLLEIASRR